MKNWRFAYVNLSGEEDGASDFYYKILNKMQYIAE